MKAAFLQKALTPLFRQSLRLQQPFRLCSSDLENAIPIDFELRDVLRDDVEVTFSRSSGPGGQNVNKVNTKVDMRLSLDSTEWIPDAVKDALRRQNSGKINKEGELVVVSTKHRTQTKNIDDALEKMNRILDDAVESIRPREEDPVKKKKLEKQKKKANENRLKNKKMMAMKKSDRRSKEW